MDKRLFRDAMGKFATGITVVTADHQNDIKGITVNAFMSLSLDPTLVAISIDQKAAMYTILQEVDTFGISVLAEDQKEQSMVFANQKSADSAIKFDQLAETPVLNGALVQLACEKESFVQAGDHMIFIAKVNDIKLTEGQPLVYFNGAYQHLDK
ncbi:flavin oxidoreductase [Paraliobacillus quinghaiensis]|uniref:Flavin oxidoreductase n=1 Tax=Paraliobacillus quinghaiensis TaxID=470815 RepID=A0A917WX10_9BACI|nr:flavin reductase family protein [Paraliobacillus quinghaiensis]GGM37727.1 flavin oxidoreductase [Paraliobacillus quinghaiensis]